MNTLNDGMIGNLPKNINKEVPTPKSDAKFITKLVKHSGEVVGYELSSSLRPYTSGRHASLRCRPVTSERRMR